VALHAATLAGIPLPIVRLDETGATLWANEAASRFAGREAGASGAWNWWQSVAPGVLGAQVHRLLSELRTAGSVSGFPMRLRGPDGERTVLWNAAAELDDTGRLVAFEGVMNEPGPAAPEGPDLFAEVVRACPSGILLSDLQNRIVQANPAMERMCGFTSGELGRRNPAEFYAKTPGNSMARMELRNAFREKRPGRVEALKVKKDGTRYWADVQVAPVEQAGGAITHWVGVENDITAQKEMEESLQESEQRFDLAVRGSGAGIWEWNLIENQFYFSTQCLKFMGYRQEDLAADPLPFQSLVHPDDEIQVIEALRDHLTQRAPFDIECRMLTQRNGATQEYHPEYRWFRNRGLAVWDASGQPLRMAGAIDDVTERHVAEEKLRDAMAFQRAVLDSANYSIIATDRDGVITTYNRAAEQLLGLRAAEVVGVMTPEAFHPEGQFAQLREQVARQWQAVELECVYVTRGGGRVPVRLAMCPIHDGAGQPVGYLEIAYDITALKENERAVRFQSQIIGQIHDAVVAVDQEGRITSWNQGAATMFGYPAAEVIGQPVTMLGVEFPEQTGEQDSNTELELPLRRKSGETFWGHFSLSRLRSEDGATGTIGYCMDVTGRKLAEAELIKAKEMAEGATKAKSEFLAMMSHEIRTPMNGVIGMTGLLLDTTLNAEQREYCEAVKLSAESLLSIINDILDFSKIEAGKMTIEPIPFDLQVAIEDVAELLAYRAREKKLDLLTRFDLRGVTRVVGDPGRLRQVIINLAGNAVKFTGAGHVLIEAELVAQAGGRAEFRISVHDTGIGIAGDRIGKLFGQFEQADSSTARKFGGTGLGLAISKRLIQLMGGEVGVSSVPGEGSTFWCKVPLPLQTEGTMPVLARGSIRGVRVLIVDDSAVNRVILTEHLQRAGAIAHAVGSGEDAISALRNRFAAGEAFQVAVIDQRLAGEDGLELGRQILGMPESAGIRLAALSSNGERGDTARFESAGFSAYLSRPIRESVLLDAVAALAGPLPGGSIITRFTLAEGRAETPTVAKEAVAASGGRVLVAEDNVVNQKLALRLLEKLGYRVDIVANGREAVDMWSRLPYDVILMDCHMPEIDGYEATGQIRERESAGVRIPIIALTANAMEGEREKCIVAGMDDFLSKPINREQLARTLEHWIKPADGGPIASSPLSDAIPQA